jgi:serine protease Do
MFSSFRDAARSVIPTVVTIEALHGPRRTREWLQANEKHSFDDADAATTNSPESVDEPNGIKENYIGSGIILDGEGIILTNYHVVVGADAVIVRLPDGEEFRADDIRGDGVTDLATIRITASRKLPAATLGDSDEVEVGDPVALIGSPLCLERSVSAGVVSAKDRKMDHKGAYLIQTDACSNPGNSGGPLVDEKGRVIGIVEGTVGEKGESQGLNFVIPINVAKRVTDRLLRHGCMIWPVLGADSQELTPRIAECMGLPVNQHGVLLTDIAPEMPAERAGLQPGDIVTYFAGRRVSNSIQLQKAIDAAPVDAVCHLGLIRDGRSSTKEITLEPYSMPLPPTPAACKTEPESAEEMFGIAVSEIEQPEELGFEGHPTGVLVTNVRRQSAAFFSDIRAGMIVRMVNGKTISSVVQFKDAVKHCPCDKSVMMLLGAPGGSRFVLVQQ